MMFTAEELELLRRAVTIPTCWDPRVRKEALAVVERMASTTQLSLLEPAEIMDPTVDISAGSSGLSVGDLAVTGAVTPCEREPVEPLSDVDQPVRAGDAEARDSAPTRSTDEEDDLSFDDWVRGLPLTP